MFLCWKRRRRGRPSLPPAPIALPNCYMNPWLQPNSFSPAALPLFCFSFSLASPSSLSLSLSYCSKGLEECWYGRKGKEAELIDGANYHPLAACCLRPQIRLKPKLISLATWPDQVGGCSGPAGPAHFKPQHPLLPPDRCCCRIVFQDVSSFSSSQR